MELEDYEFAVCLTHDVDRPYKTFQGPYYAVKERDYHHIMSAANPNKRPYWQFEEIMQLEDDLGVRSTFFFLNEQNLLRDRPPLDWLKPEKWKLFAGRYDITDGEIVSIIRELDRGGWEIGLHGSYESYNDVTRLQREKEVLEDIVGHKIHGVRQHYLNLEQPDTWKLQKSLGLTYDASLGSSTEVGFNHGYDVHSPFKGEFIVFPLTVMEIALMSNDNNIESSWNICKKLLEEGRRNTAVLTILWHPRYFNTTEYPGYRELYCKFINKAKELGAWVGPCGKFQERFY